MGREDREVPQDLAGPLGPRLSRESCCRPDGRDRARGRVPGGGGRRPCTGSQGRQGAGSTRAEQCRCDHRGPECGVEVTGGWSVLGSRWPAVRRRGEGVLPAWSTLAILGSPVRGVSVQGLHYPRVMWVPICIHVQIRQSVFLSTKSQKSFFSQVYFLKSRRNRV